MSPLVVIFVTVFIDLLGFGIIIPLLPFYAESFGASAFTIGLLGTSFSLMQFLFSPLWGRWSDKIGRKPIILASLAVLVFVPIRYVYPSRTIVLKWPTLALGTIWAIVFTWIIWRLPAVDGPWTMISLVFPVYYVALSLWLQAGPSASLRAGGRAGKNR